MRDLILFVPGHCLPSYYAWMDGVRSMNGLMEGWIYIKRFLI